MLGWWMHVHWHCTPTRPTRGTCVPAPGSDYYISGTPAEVSLGVHSSIGCICGHMHACGFLAAPPHASCLLRVQQVAKPAELLDYLTLSYYGYSGQVASQNEIL